MGNASILDELRPALRSAIAALAEALLGPPDTRNGRELRWGAKGSFRVIVSGSKQGACCDFEGGWKGDPLALIMRERRTDFQGAIEYGCQFVGIAFDGKSTPEDPAERAARDAERERKRAEASLEQKADEVERIAYARNLWNANGPIDGTVALEYLAITRAIPRPATGWPDATVRYHAGTASLILAGTNAVGEVCFVQRIALTIDGRKIDGTPKITNGVMAGCYMPNTVSAYLHDLKFLFAFLLSAGLTLEQLNVARSIDFMAYLTTRPRRVGGRHASTPAIVSDRLAPATINRVMAAVSTFYEHLARFCQSSRRQV